MKSLKAHQESNSDKLGINDPILERDIKKILKVHLKLQFWFDALANFPIIAYFAIYGRPVGEDEIVKASDQMFFILAMGLKVLRLINVKNFIKTLRDTFDKIAEIFYLHRYMLENIYQWIKIVLKFVLVIHYFACGWQLIRFYKDTWGLVSHPFQNDKLLPMYVESIYTITTTISTVGYGD